MKSLTDFFPECLEKAAENKKLVLVLDSLDQLSVDDGGRLLDWLPASLPYNVYVVLSTLPGEDYQCLPSLRVCNIIFVKEGKICSAILLYLVFVKILL